MCFVCRCHLCGCVRLIWCREEFCGAVVHHTQLDTMHSPWASTPPCICCCRKHDLWVLSNQPLLKASAADSSGPYDRLNQPWVVLTR